MKFTSKNVDFSHHNSTYHVLSVLYRKYSCKAVFIFDQTHISSRNPSLYWLENSLTTILLLIKFFIAWIKLQQLKKIEWNKKWLAFWKNSRQPHSNVVFVHRFFLLSQWKWKHQPNGIFLIKMQICIVQAFLWLKKRPLKKNLKKTQRNFEWCSTFEDWLD